MLHYLRAQAVPNGTSKLHEDVDQMFMVLTPAALLSLSYPAPAHVSSEGVPYDQLAEENRTWAWLRDGFAP